MTTKGPFYYIEQAEHENIMKTINLRPVIYTVMPLVDYEGATSRHLRWFHSLKEAKEHGEYLVRNGSDIAITADNYVINILLDGGESKSLSKKNIIAILEIEK